MLIRSFSATSSGADTYDLLQPADRLMFVVYRTPGDGVTNKEIVDDFMNGLAAGKIIIDRYKKGGAQKSLVPETLTLRDIAAVCAANEGYIWIRKAAAGKPGTHVMTFSIELSNAGSIPLSANDYLKMQLSGLNSVGAAVEMHIIEGNRMNDEHLRYYAVPVRKEVLTRQACGNSYGLFVDGSKIMRVKLYNANGTVQELTADELDGLLPETNEVAINCDGIFYPYAGWYYINCVNAVDAEILYNTDGNAVVLANKIQGAE